MLYGSTRQNFTIANYSSDTDTRRSPTVLELPNGLNDPLLAGSGGKGDFCLLQTPPPPVPDHTLISMCSPTSDDLFV
jgi:hypothetical protein